MIRLFITALAVLCNSYHVFAQDNITIAIGGMNYQGEIGNKVSIKYGPMGVDLKSMRPIIQGRLGFICGQTMSISGEFGISKFQGKDIHSRELSIANRGYSVEGNHMDFGLNIHQYFSYGSNFYAFTGLRGAYSISSVKNASNSFITQNHQNLSLVLPVGLGVELQTNGMGVLGFEWSANTVLNDKMDGVDYKYSKFSDVYSNLLITYTFPISKQGIRNQIQRKQLTHRPHRRHFRVNRVPDPVF